MTPCNQPSVSIVVPIYKVEKHLRECVDSILAQTLTNIEIILVDDGSPDGCPKIVDDYAEKDTRVVAVHQPNGGYGRAVNHGLELARGKYIGIIESDDWIEPDMFETLYARAQQDGSDLVKCGYYEYDSTKSEGEQDKENHVLYDDITAFPNHPFSVEEHPEILILHSSVWATLYRADLMQHLRMIESASASYQDFPFMFEALCRAKQVSVIPRYLLHYRQEEGQGSSTMGAGKRMLVMIDQCKVTRDFLKQFGKYELFAEEFYYHSYRACFDFFRRINPTWQDDFFKGMQEFFKELELLPSFSFKYFYPNEKEEVQILCRGGMFCKERMMKRFSFKTIRRFLFSLRIGRKGVLLQLFGLQIASPRFQSAPALWRIRLK